MFYIIPNPLYSELPPYKHINGLANSNVLAIGKTAG